MSIAKSKALRRVSGPRYPVILQEVHHWRWAQQQQHFFFLNILVIRMENIQLGGETSLATFTSPLHCDTFQMHKNNCGCC